ncbi:PD40 domain-containing protein [Winogradskyella echinorum]|uniref:Tricorn protease homolog n=1 Tax=Winogradskyella echinorum TaxID=538189 RepID=A0ABR6XYN3_9FLAO|nr:S41 family peptidase [Winogradskyella echinorum]MBC3845120.1 PD40 domain-containing protein [Winogradskyella echinorum]MBC5749468.1 PD40 domain-containing protein [Winogradskyella echinorum]
MKLNYLLLIISLLLSNSTVKAQEAYFTSDPTLSPDGQTIVFSYDGDLWKVSSTGGEALRLTAMRGEETLPRISPDGKWLAFTATQYGNKDVYVMPINGGDIKQLTFHDASDDVDSWSWDSKNIFFTSSRYNRFSGYKVAINGNTPTRLFEHYFNNVHNVVSHPKTGEIFFNESWESKNFTHRKRYKGDYNPDIKSYNPSTKTYKEYTSYNGKDMWATIDGMGKLFFASDQANGEYNLYTFVDDKKTALTNFKSSIGWPQVSSQGNKVVFTNDYQIFLYDVASNKTKKLNVIINQNNTLYKSQDFKTKNNISYFDVSSDNKKIAFVSRGELFVSDIKGEFIKKLNTNPNERVIEVKWLKDNRTLLYNQTASGYTNLFSIAADGKGQEKRHTSEARNNVNIVLDHKMKNAAYISGRDELRLLDLSTLKSTTIVKDEFWALYPPTPQFSPDNNYILYNAYRNFELDIFTYHIPSKEIINLTNTGVSEGNPTWSSDGKYIYFESNLTQPNFPRGNGNTHIYRMALDKYDAPFKTDKFNDLFKEDEKEDKKDKDKAEKKDEKSEATISVIINKEELMDRIERISPGFGSQNNTYLITDDETTYVYYISNHDEGNRNLWRTIIKPFENNKTEIVDKKPARSGQLVSAKGKHYAMINGSINSMNLSNNKLTKIETEATFRKNLVSEFNQMFHEAWAGFESNFYDEKFHGEDWQKLRDKYAKFLPYLTKRSQLRQLFNDMLGELNTSHFGFNSFGNEDSTYYGSRTSAIGIVFSKDNPYKVKRVVSKSPSDVTGKDIKVGDILTHVNGQKVNNNTNRESYFSEPSIDREMQLIFNRNGKDITVNIHPTSSGALRGLLYDEWVATNQSYVDNKSNNTIAYIHMKNMGGGELNNFMREMVSETYKKDALILDLRNNTGGNVHDAVLQFLSQKPYSKWKYREGKLAPQPNFGPAAKPIIILVNEQTLSDAEVTSAGFKELGLGKVIGTETYRWIIFTSGAGLVDGSFYRLPSWGCYTLSGDNLEFTGVKPDIYIKEDFKDRLTGNQPQLDKAIEEIMNSLKQ